MIIEAPEEPLKRKMTPRQEELLRRIVATNGGGINVGLNNEAVARGLIARHFIQGKSGSPYMAVHTKHGLEWVRNNPPKAAQQENR